MPSGQLTYPFSAIVGQEKLKLALVLNAVDPKIGGLLISGAKGAGKSLAARAFADILPEVETVEGCVFNCNPHNILEMCPACRLRLQAKEPLPIRKRRIRIVQLPISTTEDRLIGSLNVEFALKEGKKALQPGLLAEANQNVLYIDEVNLLPDYLVDCFLDPAASGWNVVQRESISFSHPARFTLIASMNPEEGELRPQILDRFPLSVRVESVKDFEQRMEITSRNSAFEEDPVGFYGKFEGPQEELKRRIVAARELLPKVVVSDKIFEGVAKACVELGVDGSRSDIAVVKAARALAAFKGKTAVEPEDVLEVSEFALGHRRRRQGYEEPPDRLTIINRLRESMSRMDIPDVDDAQPINQTGEDVLDLLKTPPTPDRRRRRRRESRLFQLIYPVFIFGIVFMLYLGVMAIAPYLFRSLVGLPTEELAESISIGRFWPYAAAAALVTLLLPLLMDILPSNRRKRRIVPIYLYKASGGKIQRKIVRQIRRPPTPPPINRLGFERIKKGEPQPSPVKILNIPLFASFGKLYRMVLNRGPKIAASLKQFREGDKRYEFSLAEKLRSRRGNLAGKRVKAATSRYGRYVYYRLPERKPWDIALAPTIRVAAPFQAQRDHSRLLAAIKPQDIRVKVREGHAPLTIVLLLDMSESMAASLDNIRNAVLSMHDLAYKKRDRVALVIFKGYGATVLQSPTVNLNLLEKKLLDVGTSDFTPLAAGMFQAWRVLRNEKLRNREITPVLIIISDGIVNIQLERPLTPFTRSRFINPAQADVIDMAGFLQRERIQTIVINTSHERKADEDMAKYTSLITAKSGKRWLDPTSLLMEIPRATGGYYYGIGEGGNIETTILMDAFTLIDKERPKS